MSYFCSALWGDRGEAPGLTQPSFSHHKPPPLSPGQSKPSRLSVWMSKKGRATAWDLPLLCLNSFICLLAIMLLDNGEQNQLIRKTAGMWQAVFSQVRTLPMAASPARVPCGAVFSLNAFWVPLLLTLWACFGQLCGAWFVLSQEGTPTLLFHGHGEK